MTKGVGGIPSGDWGWLPCTPPTGVVILFARKSRVKVGVGNNETITGVGVPTGVKVNRGVGDSVGKGVKVGVLVATGTGVMLGVGDRVGVGVNTIRLSTALALAVVCWPSTLRDVKFTKLLRLALTMKGPSPAVDFKAVVNRLFVTVKTAPGVNV